MARRKFPSDHRPWFRVLDEILTDEKLNELELSDQMVFMRILALLNVRHSRDGILHLSDHAGYLISRRHRRAYWEPVVRRLGATGVLELEHDHEPLAVRVPNWAKLQGFAPTDSAPNREEESREEKKHRKKATDTPKPEVKRAARGPTLWPKDGLTNEQKQSLVASESLKDITPSQFAHACVVVAAWSAAGDKRRVDWVAVVRGGITRGWALEGYGGGGNGKAIGRGSSNYVSPYESPNWQDKATPPPDEASTNDGGRCTGTPASK